METKFVKESIVRVVNRNDLTITGVQKVLAFSENAISLVCLDCNMSILGSQMQTQKLDVEGGDLIVSGVINQIKWESKKEKVPFLKRVFK